MRSSGPIMPPPVARPLFLTQGLRSTQLREGTVWLRPRGASAPGGNRSVQEFGENRCQDGEWLLIWINVSAVRHAPLHVRPRIMSLTVPLKSKDREERFTGIR